MKAFRGFVEKEVRHILRDPRTVAILFGMPLIMLILFGYAIRNEINKVDLVISNPLGNAEVTEIIHKLESSGYFKIVAYQTGPVDAEHYFENDRAKAVLIFGESIEQQHSNQQAPQVQLILDATEPNLSRIISNYLQAILRDYSIQKSNASDQLAGVQVEPRFLFNPELKSSYLFVPGVIAVILMLISSLMTALTITREKESGTMEILLVSPLKPAEIIIGKVLPYTVLAAANVFSILIAADILFDIPFRGSFFLFAIESMIFVIVSLALGVFISTAANTQLIAMLISLVGLLLPTIILSGFIFPIKDLPEVLQWLSHAVPAKWFLIVVRGIMLKGQGIAELWMETLVLAGMCVFFLALSTLKFKPRLA